MWMRNVIHSMYLIKQSMDYPVMSYGRPRKYFENTKEDYVDTIVNCRKYRIITIIRVDHYHRTNCAQDALVLNVKAFWC